LSADGRNNDPLTIVWAPLSHISWTTVFWANEFGRVVSINADKATVLDPSSIRSLSSSLKVRFHVALKDPLGVSAETYEN